MGVILSFEAAAIGSMKPEISDLLRTWSDGDEAAGELLAARVYEELRRIARRYMKERAVGQDPADNRPRE